MTYINSRGASSFQFHHYIKYHTTIYTHKNSYLDIFIKFVHISYYKIGEGGRNRDTSRSYFLKIIRERKIHTS